MINKMPVVGKRYRHKEECVEPVSIWKDINELPNDDVNYFIYAEFFSGMAIIGHAKNNKIFRLHSDHIYPNGIIKRWSYLTDFINEHEQMKKDIEELKRNKLEGK